MGLYFDTRLKKWIPGIAELAVPAGFDRRAFATELKALLEDPDPLLQTPLFFDREFNDFLQRQGITDVGGGTSGELERDVGPALAEVLRTLLKGGKANRKRATARLKMVLGTGFENVET